MKKYFKIILILLFIFSVVVVKGQVFKSNSNWTEMTTNLIDPSYCKITNYWMEGDTVINNLTYKKLYGSTNEKADVSLFAGIRESEQNKVYVYFFSWDEEFLVYDFSSWEIGDTLYYQLSNGKWKYNLVTAVDSIQLLDNQYYQVIRSNANMPIIRGIGETFGFFRRMNEYFPTNGDQYRLLCFSHGNQLVYKDKEFEYCDACIRVNTSGNTISPDINAITFVRLSNGMNIQLSSVINNGTIYIYNLLGKMVMQKPIVHTDHLLISGLNKGCYLYKMIGDNQPYSGKFLIP